VVMGGSLEHGDEGVWLNCYETAGEVGVVSDAKVYV